MLGQDENFHQSYGMPLGDHQYISWLAKEVWMDQLLEDATRLLQQVLDSTTDTNKVELPMGTAPSKHVDLKNSSHRLLYRFLMHLLVTKKIHACQTFAKLGQSSLYPRIEKRRVLEEEKEAYLKHMKGECKSDSEFMEEMTLDQRDKVDEELKALKEKDDQDAQTIGKKDGRPPSTNKVRHEIFGWWKHFHKEV
ncbi:hypothetical protein GOP47_0018654 [Adiantum capillus-veneris]|uniref:Uncharacterized protein n=1 Tax=Adiantum capillus-veneris TaxID=13818 RepID=A0A9D4UDZ0_ADICA|nr:hypothetical protein GOP47_0018654 [Adiantum capillus-veneris]